MLIPKTFIKNCLLYFLFIISIFLTFLATSRLPATDPSPLHMLTPTEQTTSELIIPKPTIAIFCGGHETTPSLHTTSYALGRYLGANTFGLITGGSTFGLMKKVADGYMSQAVSREKFWNILLKKYESEFHPNMHKENIMMVNSIYERLNLFCTKADACIVLPGGFGTLHELIFYLIHRKKNNTVILLNLDGFWDNIIQQFNTITTNNPSSSKHLGSFIVANTLDECIEILETRKLK